jgi:hypothetical protein
MPLGVGYPCGQSEHTKRHRASFRDLVACSNRQVLRSRFHKLRNLLEAYPRLFVILDQGLQGGDEYEVRKDMLGT